MKYHQQLSSMLKAADLTQEQLARQLDVSFATLNSWINQRSAPRATALRRIEALYLDIVGADDVDEILLRKTKQNVTKLHMTPRALTGDKATLQKLMLNLTYHTNTIEGSTMTLADVENVILEHKVLSNRTAIEQAEARNHQAALYWLIDELVGKGKDFVIDEQLILALHLRLMNGIIGDAGQYRKHSVRIMGARVALANWIKIPSLIEELTSSLNDSSGDLIKNLATTHASFEKIHPFTDGNGRTGRLLMLAQCLKASLTPALIIKERKHAYYKYLEKAQTTDDHQPLELFIAESIEFTHKLLNEKSL